MAAEDIHGNELGCVQGKTVRHSPHQVNTEVTFTPLPRKVHEHYSVVTICADIMHVNGAHFFVSISRNIKLGIIAAVPNLNQATLDNLYTRISSVSESDR
jgi:hypothetical protein